MLPNATELYGLKKFISRGVDFTPIRKKKQRVFVNNSKTVSTYIMARSPSQVQGVNPAPLNLSSLIAVSSDFWPWQTDFM